MTATRPVSRRDPATAAAGTKVLVAAGDCAPGRPCIDGELVWVPPPCGSRTCSCLDSFSGAATRGITDRARVELLAGVDRGTVRRVLQSAICTHCVPDAAARRAEAKALLDLAARFPVGAVLERFGGAARTVAAGR